MPYSKHHSGGRPKKPSLPYLRQPSKKQTVAQKEKQASSWQQSRCKERPLRHGATCMAYQAPDGQLLVDSVGDMES